MNEMLPKVGVGILVLSQGKVLLGKRQNAHGEGTWAPPGGHLEFGETISACTLRELFEETGLKAESIIEGPWREIFFKEEGKHYLNIFTIVPHFSGDLEIKEANKTEEWQWFPFSELPTPLFAPLKKIILENSLENFFQEHLLKKPLISYLCAPYNHSDPVVRKNRYDLITETAAKLIEEGTFVFSPITHNVPIRDVGNMTCWDDWCHYDLTMLSLCKQLIVLKIPGWEESKGVQAELAFAMEKDIPIIEMTPIPAPLKKTSAML